MQKNKTNIEDLLSETRHPTVRPAEDRSFEEAAGILRAGGLVAFPTETVYGLGADATSDAAVTRIFEAKARPRFNPLIVHFTDVAAAGEEVVFDARAEAVAERFWPGPLTLVLPRRAGSRLSLLCSAGLDTQAVRLPAHPIAQRLLAEADLPLAAPSANASGRISPTRADHVAESLGGRVPLILDGGPCAVGLESTVLDLSTATPTVLRPGAVTAEDLGALLGPLAEPAANPAVKAPGMLSSHYAPDKPLRLGAETIAPDEALLAFGPEAPDGAAVTLNLSAGGNLAEAAANLFAFLRRLDESAARGIAVMPVPDEGLGTAINDRLRRAATPRSEPQI
ncbi:L-threonylcarbamoyladenylate synthase [Pelagibius sp.]|uniref:L-threonylcarbamoyladenylate synthase n=1 Tax=Pelagibius sp. TaxID=1931238 RepID=UPI00262EE22B|nr:L-threonylcarbamoyladenylate synthase [Pelagibius sp.]